MSELLASPNLIVEKKKRARKLIILLSVLVLLLPIATPCDGPLFVDCRGLGILVRLVARFEREP